MIGHFDRENPGTGPKDSFESPLKLDLIACEYASIGGPYVARSHVCVGAQMGSSPYVKNPLSVPCIQDFSSQHLD